MIKTVYALGAVATVAGLLLTSTTGPANAAACAYSLKLSQSAKGQFISASARKTSTACKRARKECERKLNRAVRKGQTGFAAGCFKR